MSSEVAQLKAEIKRLRAERTAWKQRAIESAAAEREACAKWLEDGIYLDRKKETGVHKYTMDLLADLANGIRARGDDART